MNEKHYSPKTDAPPPRDVSDPALVARARAAASGFDLPGNFAGIEPYGSGHINRTYVFSMDQGGKRLRYLIQLLNTFAFREPFGLMDNMVRVTEHLRRRLASEGVADLSRRVLSVLRARDGNPYLIDSEGGFWRAFVFIEGVRTCEVIDSPRRATALGEAVGRFQNLLSDLPGPRLAETIPGFHDARRRFAAFERAIAADSLGRAASARREIDFYLANRDGFDRIVAALESGEVPERTTHNDTKVNNLLLDETTDEAICLIDLDTVMPGSSAYDFGDLARTVAASTAEDDPDSSRMEFVLPMYEAIARGYAAGTDRGRGRGSFLTPTERELLPASGRILTMLMGIRFLTDYLEGDTYYHISRSGHNLDRSRTQMALIASMDRHRGEMIAATKAAFSGIG